MTQCRIVWLYVLVVTAWGALHFSYNSSDRTIAADISRTVHVANTSRPAPVNLAVSRNSGFETGMPELAIGDLHNAREVKSQAILDLLKRVCRENGYTDQERRRCLGQYVREYIIPGMSLQSVLDQGVIDPHWISESVCNLAVMSQCPNGISRDPEGIAVFVEPPFSNTPLWLVCPRSQVVPWKPLFRVLRESGGDSRLPGIVISQLWWAAGEWEPQWGPARFVGIAASPPWSANPSAPSSPAALLFPVGWQDRE